MAGGVTVLDQEGPLLPGPVFPAVVAADIAGVTDPVLDVLGVGRRIVGTEDELLFRLLVVHHVGRLAAVGVLADIAAILADAAFKMMVRQ